MYKYFIVVITCILVLSIPLRSHADTISDLQQKIDQRNQVIKQLDAEIAKYQDQIGQTSAKTKTLQATLASLDASIKKLQAETAKTQTNLDKTTDTIAQLTIEISAKQEDISKRQMALQTLIKSENQQESLSLVEQVLGTSTLSDAWNYFNESVRIQDAITQNLDAIKTAKTALETNVTARQSQKAQYIAYKNTLADQQKLVVQSQQDQASLLKKTKNDETAYRKSLADSLALKNAFEKELNDYQSQLKRAIDPNSIPKIGTAVLGWPLDGRIIVTQQFGDTDFSRSHAGVYNGKGHNGVDMGAPIGTPIKAAANGFVVGTGNTDTTCPGASFGKWVLVQHPMGLSTLYAHMSLIKVSPGDKVSEGDLLGYVGITGYTTGPHLHFTVYATQGVEIMSLPSKSCHATYTMPIADLKAYLNPLLYLPAL